jgi:ATP adenylyltransferase
VADKQSSDEAGFEGIGIPDRWQRLWAPHRMAYLKGENRPLRGNEISCPFCEIPTRDDESGLVVARAKHNYVVLNLYPYNPGHLLICSYRHVAELPELTVEERSEMAELAAHAMEVLRKVRTRRDSISA